MSKLADTQAKLQSEFTKASRRRIAEFSLNAVKIEQSALASLDEAAAELNHEKTLIDEELASLNVERENIVNDTKATLALLEEIAEQETITETDLDRITDLLVGNLLKSLA